MANLWEEAKQILAENLNSGLGYLITTVLKIKCRLLDVNLSFECTLKNQNISWLPTLNLTAQLANSFAMVISYYIPNLGL